MNLILGRNRSLLSSADGLNQDTATVVKEEKKKKKLFPISNLTQNAHIE